MKYLSAALAPALLFPAVAPAQSVFDLDEIVFSAAFGEETLEETGSTITVVTREDIEETGETRLIDYLARLPGVDVRARGPIGSLTSVTIRGVGQNYVRVLVDGIDVTDVSGTQVAFDFGSLTTADISRIELLRGGQSAVYGSEAIGGVINITTRRADQDGVSQFATIEAGSYNSVRGSYGVAVRQGPLDYSLTLTRTQTDGFSAADENNGNAEADGFESNRLSFSIGHDLANGGRVGLNGFVERARLEFDEQTFDARVVADGSPDEESLNNSQGLRAFLETPTGPIDSTFAATYYRMSRDSRSTGFVQDSIGERLGLSYLGAATINPSIDIRFGVDATREIYSEVSNFGSSSGNAEVIGVFSEVGWSLAENADLVATLRHDDHSRFGGMFSGRLAASWRPTDNWIIRSSVAQSFRAPSLYELFGPNGTATLQPEESRSLDFSVERRFDSDAFLRTTLFFNETENLIDLVGSNYVQIAGNVRRRGAEVEFGSPLNDNINVEGSYTFTIGENPTISPGNAWNAEYPKHDLSLTLTGALTDRLSAAFAVQSVWDRPTLGNYAIGNATFTYDVRDDIEAYVRVENLFDREYQLQRGYGTSDRAVYVGLRSRF